MKKKIIYGVLTVFLVLSLTACSGALQIEVPGLDDLQVEIPNEEKGSIPLENTTDELPGLPSTPEPLNLQNLESLQTAYTNIYEKVIPSVVSITAQQMIDTSGLEGIPFDFDFGSPDDEDFQYPSTSAGSGFVWDTDGHIITNNHVIENAEVIRVNFSDGRSVLADLVGADADSDLAVLKVDLPEDELVPITVSDSLQVKVGQIAVAIGNPFSLESSMTTGIVSGIGRSLPIDSGDGSGLYYSIPDVIQTDAAINPGNSGGVLVDINGGLIGVTTAIESPVRANSGVGYVIPSVIVTKVVPLLIRDGEYLQPWIGISGLDLTPEYANLMDLDPAQGGALIQEVQPNSPAEEAGLLGSGIEGEIDGIPVTFGGDIIVGADDDPINDFEDLVAFLARRTVVGQTISLTVIREGKLINIDLTLQARPGSTTNETATIPEEVGDGAWLGISGIDMNEDIAEEMDLAEDSNGVLIQTITADSPADEAGLRGSYKPVNINGQEVFIGGDVIIQVDRETITSMQDLSEIISNNEPGDEVSLTVLRDGRTLRVNVTLGEFPSQ